MILTRVRMWLRTVLLRGRLDREMQDEMRGHLERSTHRLMQRGLTRAEAVRQATLEFGRVDSIEEQARDARGARWVETTIADLRYGLRHLSRAPLSTVTMVLVLVLGIGANTALFTIMHSLLTLPPAGVTRDESVVRIRGLNRNLETGRIGNRSLSYPEVQDYAARSAQFRDVAAFFDRDVVLASSGDQASVEAANATFVTGNYFRILGVRPVLGAGLPVDVSARAASAPSVAMIGYAFWERQYGRSADVLGKTIKVNDVTVTIVGVAPRRFGGEAHTAQVWLPLALVERVGAHSLRALSSYDSTFLSAVAQLQPGVKLARALPTVESVAARTAQFRSQPPGNTTPSADVAPLRTENARKDTSNELTVGFAVAWGISLLILLITCTNVSALLVGLAVARRREIAVRLSLGAGRTRLIRQLLTESFLLAVTAASLAILLMWVLLRVFREQLVDVQIELHWTAFVFTLGSALATGILFGLSPALHATRLAVGDVLKDSAGTVAASRSRLQRALVAGQIALTQPLLVGLGGLILLVLSSANRYESRLNEHIIELRFGGRPEVEKRRDQLSQVQERLGALPGVTHVVPATFSFYADGVTVHPSDRIAERGSRSIELGAIPVARGHFALFDLRFVRGRDFSASERATTASQWPPKRNTPVEIPIVIKSSTARQLWGSANPIGRRLVGRESYSNYVVVGVVEEVSVGRADDDSEVHVYIPDAGLLYGLHVRTEGPAAPLLPLIRRIVTSEMPQLPLNLRTLADRADAVRKENLRQSAIAGGAGLLALILSALGIYAVVAFAVNQRIREIGVRTALGADRRQLVGQFFFQGLRISFVGLAIGLPFSMLTMRGLLLTEDRLTVNAPLLAVIATIVLLTAALATWIPARRAASVDPMTALRLD